MRYMRSLMHIGNFKVNISTVARSNETLKAPDNFWVHLCIYPQFLNQCWFSKFQMDLNFHPLYCFASGKIGLYYTFTVLKHSIWGGRQGKREVGDEGAEGGGEGAGGGRRVGGRREKRGREEGEGRRIGKNRGRQKEENEGQEGDKGGGVKRPTHLSTPRTNVSALLRCRFIYSFGKHLFV